MAAAPNLVMLYFLIVHQKKKNKGILIDFIYIYIYHHQLHSHFSETDRLELPILCLMRSRLLTSEAVANEKPAPTGASKSNTLAVCKSIGIINKEKKCDKAKVGRK